jgi:hypothetical protein
MSEGENKNSEWKLLIQNFVTNMLSKMSDNISEKIQNWFRNLMKRGTGLFLAMIGLVFVMVSASFYLNTVWNDKDPWIGFGVVGVVACCVGIFMSRK